MPILVMPILVMPILVMPILESFMRTEVRGADRHPGRRWVQRRGITIGTVGTLPAKRAGMTAPRRIVANATVMITRRCLDRMFLLRPSKIANELFSYVLAVAAAKYGILLHAYCVLSNHFHLVLTDPAGNLPRFEQYLDALVARAFNALYGRWDYFWTSGSYSAVALVTPGDILDKMAYVLANPVAAGLVPTGSEWPGLWSAPERIGSCPMHVKRPKHFFRKRGPMPESVRLELVCPPGFESEDAFRAQLAAAVKEREQRAAQRLAAEGRSFLGAERVLAQSPTGRPVTEETRRELKPEVACRDKWKRIEALQRLKEFRLAYRIAWRAFARGVRSTIFPHGTYLMRVNWGVACASG
jgi:REP element-mobilizing transposase RayT